MTDNIKAAFEAWEESMKPNGFGADDIWEAAYIQAQRDLIAAMQPMGWKVGLCVYDTQAEAEQCHPMPVIPLYSLPEDVQK